MSGGRPRPVVLDRRVRRGGARGELLVGGTPTTFLRLGAAAASALVRGPSGTRLEPGDDPELGALTEKLVERGLAHPDLTASEETGPLGCAGPQAPVLADLAIVVPVKDDPTGLAALLEALAPERAAGVRVVVVDDGSATSVEVPPDVVVLRHDTPRGPAAARNAGLRAAQRPLVAFLDADVHPLPGWTVPLLAHLADEQVVLVAPRIVAAEPGHLGIRGYETARSALDLGPDPAPVRPRGPVPYVPSAAMVLRPGRLAGVPPSAVDPAAPFDETMRVAEDVDLCWRLADAGAVMRYEPASRVAHRHRLGLVELLRRRSYYGSGAARLAETHGAKVAPAVFSAPMLGIAAGLWWFRPWSLCLAGLLAARNTRRLHAAVGDRALAAAMVAGGAEQMTWQLASAAWRPYWPVTAVVLAATVVGGVGSPTAQRRTTCTRLRRRLVAMALAEGVRHWWAVREPGRLPVDDPISHLTVHRLDDLAYGLGVWRSAAGARSFAALRPDLS